MRVYLENLKLVNEMFRQYIYIMTFMTEYVHYIYISNILNPAMSFNNKTNGYTHYYYNRF